MVDPGWSTSSQQTPSNPGSLLRSNDLLPFSSGQPLRTGLAAAETIPAQMILSQFQPSF